MIILFFLVSFLVAGKIVIKYYSKHWDDGLSASVHFETDAINEGEKGHICEEIINDKIDSVFGGFHLYNPPTRKYESDEMIDNVIDSLQKKGSIYYTCHCTGPKAYKRMKRAMGDKMNYLSTGTEIVK